MTGWLVLRLRLEQAWCAWLDSADALYFAMMPPVARDVWLFTHLVLPVLCADPDDDWTPVADGLRSGYSGA